MYAGVPSERPVSVKRSLPSELTASAIPKSATSGLAILDQDVLGLDVAVDDAPAVGGIEGRGDAAG